MSFELGEAIRRCGLETGARRAVLDALACYTDADTGLARVSRVSIAVHAGVNERTVQRVLKELCGDAELQGLVRMVRESSGRGNPAVYRVDIARLEPLADAIKSAGRRVFAGVGKAMADWGLIGRKATPENIRAAFSCLMRLLREEGQENACRVVESLRGTFEEALQRSVDVAIIGTPLEGKMGGDRPVDKSAKGGQDVSLSGGQKGDISSRKGDISSRPYNKDSSPSGITPFARDAREACGKILAAQAVGQGELVFCTEGLLASATLNREERLQLIRDLQGRIVRVSPDGILAIRVRDDADAEAMADRWLEALVRWATEVGLSGVVFDAAFAPEGGPAPMPKRED
ncbi:hypothetical protein [Hyphomonas pacifica]|uniref:Uncharacterized protein n=1 Tax=Hyphomonas pacifica TaxID=1280941 RepID=A0A8B2PJA4_9PROT|nr:hypothetical protein [Hyphomonas pacifica]RAN30647.1 hypothetical protein HY3_05715 [Hyphomonas pacifica]